jgi:hypothetical protein
VASTHEVEDGRVGGEDVPERTQGLGSERDRVRIKRKEDGTEDCVEGAAKRAREVNLFRDGIDLRRLVVAVIGWWSASAQRRRPCSLAPSNVLIEEDVPGI